MGAADGLSAHRGVHREFLPATGAGDVNIHGVIYWL